MVLGLAQPPQPESGALDPATVEGRNLAWALPATGRLPRWARGPGGDWRTTGHRCVVPLFDHTGEIVSVRARAVLPDVSPKNLAPAGYAVAGLVMADALGRLMLAVGYDATVVALVVAAEKQIVSELVAVQGKPADIGGYYLPDDKKLHAVMCASPTFNAALASVA